VSHLKSFVCGLLMLVPAQIAPPVQLPPRVLCSSAELALSFVRAEGAAGTILDVLALTNTSTAACVLDGYVAVQMLDADGVPMPTVDVPGGGIWTNFAGPSAFPLPPGATASFGITWSDVFTGDETSCPAASTLQVSPPGDIDALEIALPALAPCNSGRINVGPLRPPGSEIPS
jgi:Protein of unknown function (DUF4232)